MYKSCEQHCRFGVSAWCNGQTRRQLVVNARVYPHVHLHIDALFQVVHDPGDACLKIGPSATTSMVSKLIPKVVDRRADKQEAYVAPISSRLGTGGIWLAIASRVAMLLEKRRVKMVAKWRRGVDIGGMSRGCRGAPASKGGSRVRFVTPWDLCIVF